MICHYTNYSVRTKVCFFKACFSPYLKIFHDHNCCRIIRILKIMRDLHAHDKVSGYFRVFLLK